MQTFMRPQDFEQQLLQQGFDKIVTVERPPDGALDEHTHPFEARALVLEGEITLGTAAGEHTYRAGDIFHLPHAEPHTERYGPQGARYLVDRR